MINNSDSQKHAHHLLTSSARSLLFTYHVVYLMTFFIWRYVLIVHANMTFPK